MFAYHFTAPHLYLQALDGIIFQPASKALLEQRGLAGLSQSGDRRIVGVAAVEVSGKRSDEPRQQERQQTYTPFLLDEGGGHRHGVQALIRVGLLAHPHKDAGRTRVQDVGIVGVQVAAVEGCGDLGVLEAA